MKMDDSTKRNENLILSVKWQSNKIFVLLTNFQCVKDIYLKGTWHNGGRCGLNRM